MTNEILVRRTVAIPGTRGPAGQIVEATAVPLEDGEQPTVTLGGTPEKRTMEFGLPRGPKGDKGDPGNGSVNSVNGDLGPEVVLGPTDVGGSTSATAGTLLMRGADGTVPGVGAPKLAGDAVNKSYLDALIARPPINLAAEGVPGDGTASAAAKFQAVVNAAPPWSTITAPLGQVYSITAGIRFTKPVTLLGVDMKANPNGSTLIIASEDVVFDTISISGPGSAKGVVSNQFFISSDGTATRMRARARIRNSTFNGCQQSHIWADWLTDFIIEDNVITDGQYAGIMMLSPKGGVIRGNTIRGIQQGGSLVNSYGIAVTDIDNTMAARAEDVLIDGNFVFDVPWWEGIDTHGGKNVSIVNNTIVGCPNPIAVTVGSDNRVSAPEGCIVSNNYMQRGTIKGVELAGIVFNGKTGGGLPDRFADGTIGHNVIRGFQKDLIMDYTYNAKTVVAPQSHDGPIRRTPAQAAYREWAAQSSVTIPANQLGGTSSITFPAGYFSIAPIVSLTKVTDSGARAIPYVKSVTKDGCTIGLFSAETVASSAKLDIPVHITAIQTGAVVNGITSIA